MVKTSFWWTFKSDTWHPDPVEGAVFIRLAQVETGMTCIVLWCSETHEYILLSWTVVSAVAFFSPETFKKTLQHLAKRDRRLHICYY